MPTRENPRFACQTYSWQMSGKWFGRLDEIVASIADAGISAIEPEVCMTGGYERAEDLKALLDRYGIELAALTLVLDWQGAEETAQERAEADRVIGVLQSFPGTKLAFVQMPREDWEQRERAQDNLLACLGAITQRAQAAGIDTTFHPNSPMHSIVRTRSDYERVLPRLPDGLGWTPDVGHLVAGGLDPVKTVREYRRLVNHIHLKDVAADGGWAQNGTGVADMVGAVRVLAETGYDGWIVLEDESSFAEADPHAAAAANAAYANSQLVPLFENPHHESAPTTS